MYIGFEQISKAFTFKVSERQHMKTLFYNGHKIEVHCWGAKKVLYDNKLVASKHSMLGGALSFEIEEGAEIATYEVQIFRSPFSNSLFFRFLDKLNIRVFYPFIISPLVEIRRNGILLYSDRQTTHSC